MSTVFRGSCLCQNVSFEIRGKLTGISFCHCSKCRKVTGTGSGAIAVASPKHLVWLSGEQYIHRFELESGWSSTFCSCCGSPLPQHDTSGSMCFVPAGSLDDDPGQDIMGHIHIGSKASWNHVSGDFKMFDEGYE